MRDGRGFRVRTHKAYKNPPLCYQLKHLNSITEINGWMLKFEKDLNISSKTLKRMRKSAKKRIDDLKFRAY